MKSSVFVLEAGVYEVCVPEEGLCCSGGGGGGLSSLSQLLLTGDKHLWVPRTRYCHPVPALWSSQNGTCQGQACI